MTKILTIRDKQEWVSYVHNAAEYDFYHTWHYHSLETNGQPLLFIYEDKEAFIAFPLLKRSIPESVHYDLCCVYGYSGPFSNKKMEELDDSLMECFKAAFLNFLSDENYISVFSRMHPFYKQHTLLEKFGGVYENGLTVALDLSISIEEQRAKYSQGTRDAIRCAWKKGFQVKEGKGPEAIALFKDIYTESMQRLGASEYYLFNDDYFNNLLNTDEYNAKIIMVYNGDEVMTSSIITLTNGIIQAHLLGTRNQYLSYSPTKVLVDEVTLLGRRLGMRYFNLGGGVGFKQDKLFEWKAAFSKLHLDYKSWRFIANPTIYQELLEKKGI
jgi:hypothetical protein